MECVEAQETLLHIEPRSTSRMGGPARIASLIGATALLAIGGNAAWGGMSISEREVMGASENTCSDDGHSCADTLCCTSPDSKCWQKNEHWAACNATCNSNMMWEDNAWVEKEEKIWDCTPLAAAEDEVLPCVANGGDCLGSKCCSETGSKCFRKNEHWASCNATCTSSYLWADGGWKDQGEGQVVWNCEELLPEDKDIIRCDLSECEGCQDDKCTSCHENKERDCCLEDLCKDSQGEQVAKCKEENLNTCCEGKSGQCAISPLFKTEDSKTEACEQNPESANCTQQTEKVNNQTVSESTAALEMAQQDVKDKTTANQAACETGGTSQACADAVAALQTATQKEKDDDATLRKGLVDTKAQEEKSKCGGTLSTDEAKTECQNAKDATLKETMGAIKAIKEANKGRRSKDTREHQRAEAASMEATNDVDAALQQAIARMQAIDEVDAAMQQAIAQEREEVEEESN